MSMGIAPLLASPVTRHIHDIFCFSALLVTKLKYNNITALPKGVWRSLAK